MLTRGESYLKFIKAVGRFFWDLLIGETPGLTAGVATLVVSLTLLYLLGVRIPYLLAPFIVVVTLFFSLRHQLKDTSKRRRR